MIAGFPRPYDPLSESDLSTDELADRLLRESSIDHLLPDTPDTDEDEAASQEPANESVFTEHSDELAALIDPFMDPLVPQATHSDLVPGTDSSEQPANAENEQHGEVADAPEQPSS